MVSWNGSSEPVPKAEPASKEKRDPMTLIRSYQSLLDSGQFENRAAIAHYLGVSHARAMQVTNSDVRSAGTAAFR